MQSVRGEMLHKFYSKMKLVERRERESYGSSDLQLAMRMRMRMMMMCCCVFRDSGHIRQAKLRPAGYSLTLSRRFCFSLMRFSKGRGP